MMRKRVCKCGKPATASIMINGISARLCPECAARARAKSKAFGAEADFNTDLARFRERLYKEKLAKQNAIRWR